MTTATQVQLRRGTATQTASFTGAAAEATVDTTNNRLIVHDGSTAGGIPHATESYVQAQIAALAVGLASNLTLWNTCF